MKRIACFFLLFCLLMPLAAAEYTVDNLPLPYLSDRTRHVSNPDGLLSAAVVSRMDSMLTRLETAHGIQSVVAVVERVSGGDCYEFAMELGNRKGVGNRQNTGLIILLSTGDRCYYILTGEGLEGVLPDALCRRIENRKMVPHLKAGEWDEAMSATVEAVCRVIENDGSLKGTGMEGGRETHDEDIIILSLMLFMLILLSLFVMLRSRRESVCPKCGRRGLMRVDTHSSINRMSGIRTVRETYRCPHCGHTTDRIRKEPFDNGTGFGGIYPPLRGWGGRGGFGGGGFSGGSFGGGSFGGGGAGGKF